jgi:hypothetical protein
LAEVATNNHQSETTSLTTFFANNGGNPHLNLDITEQQDLFENHDAQEHTTKLQEIHPLTQPEMSFAQVEQQEKADQYRYPAPAYSVGVLVWLNARHIITHCSSLRLDHECLGPFPILAIIGRYACSLQLPQTILIYYVFYIHL